MFTRIVKFRIIPSKTHEALAITHETIKPALEKIEGVKMMVITIDRESGLGSATTIYDSRENAGLAQEIADHVWGFLSIYLIEPPQVSEQDIIFWMQDGNILVSEQ